MSVHIERGVWIIKLHVEIIWIVVLWVQVHCLLKRGVCKEKFDCT